MWRVWRAGPRAERPKRHACHVCCQAPALAAPRSKRFVIEVLDGEKIVSRRKGFTVETCVASALANQQMPSFQFLPLRDKVGATGNAICTHAEGARLPPTWCACWGRRRG